MQRKHSYTKLGYGGGAPGGSEAGRRRGRGGVSSCEAGRGAARQRDVRRRALQRIPRVHPGHGQGAQF